MTTHLKNMMKNHGGFKPYQATIYVGFKERDTKVMHTIEEAEAICQQYCDDIGLCVSVTPTRYIYTNGNEPGCMVGLINYPRFPSTPEEIFGRAMVLAEKLMLALGQYRVTVIAPDRVEMLSNPNL